MPKISLEYRDERRAHILAAARTCFVRDGFHATSMQDLLAEAGMSSGAVYRYFSSKDAMIEAIAEANLDQVVAIVRESLRRKSNAGEAIADVLDYVRGRHAEDGFAAIALLVWSEALRNPNLGRRLRESLTAAADALTPPASAIDADEAPDAVASALLCVLPGYLMQLAISGPETVAAVPELMRSIDPFVMCQPETTDG